MTSKYFAHAWFVVRTPAKGRNWRTLYAATDTLALEDLQVDSAHLLECCAIPRRDFLNTPAGRSPS